MKVLKPNRLSCLTRPYRFLNKDYLAFTVYAMVDFSSDFFLETEQQLWGIFNEESVLNFGAELLDFGIPKCTPEIVLNAYGFGQYAVNGRTAVSVSINNVRKDLWVSGERYWSEGRPSAAQPFDRIAISWRNAFGGAGFDENPHGKGFQQTQINGLKVRFLPNIEDPADPVTREGQRYAPAGYASIPIETPGRNLMLGTYDEQWRVHDFPGFAKDIDWAYFNQSPIRQRLNRLAAGDEIVFTHLHPEKEKLVTKVPPLTAKAFIKRTEADEQSEGFLETVPLTLTTYWAYPHREKVILIYQGAVAIGTDDASDISHVLYALEQDDAARTPVYYETVFHQRVDPASGPLYALLDKQLVDPRLIRKTALDEIELSPLLRNKLTKLDKEIERNASRTAMGDTHNAHTAAELSWLHKAPNGKIARDEIIEEMLERIRQDANVPALRKQFNRRSTMPRRHATDESLASKEERRAFLAARRSTLLESVRQRVEQDVQAGAGPQAIAGDATQDAMRQQRLQEIEQFEDLLSRAPSSVSASRKGTLGTRRYRIFNPNQRLSESLPEGYDAYELHGFTATSMSYAGGNFGELAIHESRLVDCNFSKAQMASCEFERVVFNGCDFRSVDWTQSRFKQCQFIDCRLPDVQSEKARFEDCRFVRSQFSAWLHFRISMRDCVFQQCRFVNFSCTRGRVEQVTFEHCFFLRHGFINGRINGLRMHACEIDSMSFVGLDTIAGLHLSECRVSKLYFAPQTVIDGIDVSYSTISASSFRAIDFQLGVIKASDLSSCDFSESSMREMHLQDSFFKQSLFIRSDLSRARVTNSDFSEAQMKSADMAGAQLRHVSFFNAELSMIKADADMVQQDILMDRSNIYPLRK